MCPANKAMLNAGKISPTSGTKIAGKNDAAIFLFYYQNFEFSTKIHANN